PRPPPTPTLFPYTTLFRSPVPQRLHDRAVAGVAHQQRGTLEDRGVGDGRLDPGVRRYGPQLGRVVAGPERQQDPQGPGRERVERDRKSTRLNSSHVAISYA